MNFQCKLDRLLRPIGTEHSLFMQQENGTKYHMKSRSLALSPVLKYHLRRPCLINLAKTDRCFKRFVRVVSVSIFPFFDRC